MYAEVNDSAGSGVVETAEVSIASGGGLALLQGLSGRAGPSGQGAFWKASSLRMVRLPLQTKMSLARAVRVIMVPSTSSMSMVVAF